jgi:cytochrome b involved in lipid metabolism
MKLNNFRILSFILLFIGLLVIVFIVISKPTSSNETKNSESSPATSSDLKDLLFSETNKFAFTELSKHKSLTDCWISLDTKVYDITNYVPTHPGGNEIKKGCGKKLDGTRHQGPAFKTDEIKNLVKKYQIGVLE